MGGSYEGLADQNCLSSRKVIISAVGSGEEIITAET